ncbi:MAG: CCA tRNA nucleotidyltransferase [Zestosphaera sp.]
MVKLSEDLRELLEEVKKELRPTEEEIRKGFDLFKEIRESIESSLNISYDFTVSLEGSFAKGTSIRGDIDLDVFILVRKEDLNNEWIEENIIKQLLKSKLCKYPLQLKYASHPYVTLRVEDFEIDVVPAYWAKDPKEITTAVDRTPFHTRYVNSRLNEYTRDEVRLLKKFLKSMGIYGAEVKVEGFSGYLTELIVIKYESFIEALKAVSGWREGEVVIIDDKLLRERLTPRELRKLFRDDVLIVPDPVDPRRNAASAVSDRALKIAIIASNTFLAKPSRKMFFYEPRVKPHSELIKFLDESERRVLLLRYLVPRNLPPDVLWGELKRVGKRLASLLENYGFYVIDYDFWSNELDQAFIALDLASRGDLPSYEVRVGPPKVSKGLLNFITKHSSSGKTLAVWVARDGSPKVITKRKYKSVKELLSSLSSKELSAKDLTFLSIISEFTDIPEDLKKDKDFMTWLTNFVMKEYPYIELQHT